MPPKRRPTGSKPTPTPEDAAAELHSRIYAVVRAIPKGKVSSYGQIAARAGAPGRARLVGKLLAGIGDEKGIPWHRVVAAQGRIALPEGSTGRAEQIRRLDAEGVYLRGQRVDMERFAWKERGESPLI